MNDMEKWKFLMIPENIRLYRAYPAIKSRLNWGELSDIKEGLLKAIDPSLEYVAKNYSPPLSNTRYSTPPPSITSYRDSPSFLMSSPLQPDSDIQAANLGSPLQAEIDNYFNDAISIEEIELRGNFVERERLIYEQTIKFWKQRTLSPDSPLRPFSVPSSNASMERTFSRAKDIISDERMKMSDKTLESSIALKMLGRDTLKLETVKKEFLRASS